MEPFLHVDDAGFRQAFTSEDERHLTRLIDRIYPGITKYLKGMGATPDDADEIFFIAVEVLWERGRNRGFDPGFNFYSFLLEVGKHKWYNLLRGKKNIKTEITKEAFMLLNPDPDIQELLEVVEFRENLLGYLDQLGSPCKNLLLLWAEGFSFDEIAQKLNYTSADSARQQKFKCLGRLRKIFGDGLNDQK